MNPLVDLYFADGCGRCERFRTPNCSVFRWAQELEKLRSIILECGLVEELKWSHPCYTFQEKNVLIIGAFQNYCTLSFLKGALLSDAHGILDKPGEQSQSAKIFKIDSPDKLKKWESALKEYIFEAVEVEKAGLKVAFKTIDEHDVPEELQRKLDEFPELKKAFEALTPGRRRGYFMHISQSKNSATRAARVEKCIPLILSGVGLNDQFLKSKK